MAERLSMPLRGQVAEALRAEVERSDVAPERVAAVAIVAYCHTQEQLAAGKHVLAHRSATDASDKRLHLTSIPGEAEVLLDDPYADRLETYVVTMDAAPQAGRLIPFPRPEPPPDV